MAVKLNMPFMAGIWILYIEVGRVHAWQALTRPTVRHEVINRLAVIIV